MPKKKKETTQKSTELKVGELRTPSHGRGKLRNGGTNRGGPGRPPNAFREAIRKMIDRKAVMRHVVGILERGPTGMPGDPFMEALKYFTDQGYGKATQHVEQTITETQKPVNPDELRVIYTLVLGRGMSIPQAENYIRTNPEEVKAWLAKTAKSDAEAN